MQALDFIEHNMRDFGIRKCKRLAVQGAFHTELMQPAYSVFNEALASMTIRNPRIDVYSNCSGKPYEGAGEIAKLLPKQLCWAVQWEQASVPTK